LESFVEPTVYLETTCFVSTGLTNFLPASTETII